MGTFLRQRCVASVLLAWSVPTLAASSSTPYTWNSVRIGGGGYVSGIVCHSAVKGLCYARTDVGGAYRWDADASRWIPLTDWIDADDFNLAGIDSFALDPSDPKRLYLAAGTYTTDKVGNGAILRSDDRGATFARTDLPFKLGGNELGRGNGERLSVNPADGRRLMFGSRSEGLWRSDNRGVTWQRVSRFPSVATSPAATAENSWRRQAIGIVFTVYGKNILYAGVSTRDTSLFQSTDDGLTWQAVAGQPIGLRPTHMRDDGRGGWYLTFADEPGPDSMHDGAIWHYQPATATWTDITPIPRNGKPSGFGWGDIAVDAHHPERLLASTHAHYLPAGDLLFRSTDGGAHWQELFARSDFEHTSAAWTRDHTPHWMTTVVIDPHDSDHAMFVTGYGIWASRNLQAFDKGARVNWWFQDDGLEETVPLGLASPSRGPSLISAVGDLDGFRHDDLTRAPLQLAGPPRYMNTESIDIAGLAPHIAVRAGRIRGTPTAVRAAWSEDAGASWKALASEPTDGSGAGSIAIAPDGSAILWLPTRASAAWVTRDHGQHWIQASGVPADARVLADRVDPHRFYAWSPGTGRLYVSHNAGQSFVAMSGAFADALSIGVADVLAVPHRSGELWIATATGAVHGRDDGTLLGRARGITLADSMGIGKAAPGSDVATLFVAGKLDGKRGIYRSSDNGASWTRINDDAHQFGRVGHVTGDPRVFGRVYFATGGRGIFYGDPNQ
ncbi:hypothetical protein FHW69_000613 [Luteibacter sp. Sphag1AF]|uniref:cellulase n=1 Tax=Luteibacter sp. Sphag1AF TaxID=2587031 RepID=UPI00178D42E8|nr:cellulase [Luteibacter sp. Sphag1AF]MBB3226023.1 hypothetical protein [Luteibacter sp. Sphag1AF]